ncbi:MAG: MoaD/ThiS family protein, partial [Anaerolineae bacterium]|nr:MoaD/ThiS family protein [Anaerolineae bacterium]
EQSSGSFAQLHLDMPADTTMRDLLERLSIPLEDRGITFINGELAALPGLDADLEIVLNDGDRVG